MAAGGKAIKEVNRNNKDMKKRNSAERRAALLAEYGMLIALAFIFSYIESVVAPMPVPGMKLGLANLVTIVGLYTVGIPGTVAVTLIRIVLAGFTFGNLSSMWFGLSGGIVSLTLMVIFKKLKWFSPVGVSVIGGVGHNIGQIIVAAFIVENSGVYYYLPFLMISGVVAGAVIGLVGGMVVERVGWLFRR